MNKARSQISSKIRRTSFCTLLPSLHKKAQSGKELVLLAAIIALMIIIVIFVTFAKDQKIEDVDNTIVELDFNIFMLNYLRTPVSIDLNSYTPTNMAELIAYSYLQPDKAESYQEVKRLTQEILTKIYPRNGNPPCWELKINNDVIKQDSVCSVIKQTVTTMMIPSLNTAPHETISLIFTIN